MSLYKILDMIDNNPQSKNSIGNKGESFVIDKLKTAGYQLYKKNIKKRDSEMNKDLYRLIENYMKIDLPSYKLIIITLDMKIIKIILKIIKSLISLLNQ